MFGFQVTRLEGQVTRYKSSAENAEKVEDELKAEKRKLQREVECCVLTPRKWQASVFNRLCSNYYIFSLPIWLNSCDQHWTRSMNLSRTTATYLKDWRRWSPVVAWHRLRRNAPTHQVHLLSIQNWLITRKRVILGFSSICLIATLRKRTKKKNQEC